MDEVFLVSLFNFLFVVRYVGRIFVKGSGKPLEILAKLNELAGFLPDEEIELFEVNCCSSFATSIFLMTS